MPMPFKSTPFNIMKYIKILSIIIPLVFSFPLFAKNLSQIEEQNYKNFVNYISGVFLIEQNKDLKQDVRAEKYNQLCLITNFNAKKATEFIMKYKNKPNQWQRVQTSILETLQMLK